METWKEFDHNVITHSAAHHLMAVGDLIDKYGYARVSDIARELNITRGSVSISLKPLKEIGLILQDENRHLRLSESGSKLVSAIKAKRSIMQRLFAEVLGVSGELAEVDACKMEHLISNETAARMLSFLRFVGSDAVAARMFRQAWRDYDPECAPHDVSACPSCTTGCLAERVAP